MRSKEHDMFLLYNLKCLLFIVKSFASLWILQVLDAIFPLTGQIKTVGEMIKLCSMFFLQLNKSHIYNYKSLTFQNN